MMRRVARWTTASIFVADIAEWQTYFGNFYHERSIYMYSAFQDNIVKASKC
jgi:hypothetical protein